MSTPNPSPAAPDEKPFTLSRVFAAPRELVFDVWTQEKHLMQWFGPKGCALKSGGMDLRPGGVFHYCMAMPGGHEMWGKWTFQEIVRPEKIVLINSFSNAAGEVTRHPMAPVWPLETLSTTRFTEADGQTTLTIEWVPLNATDEERKVFFGARENMRGGWGGTFEQLDGYLKTL